MLSSIRYDFLPFDSSYRLDNASTNYCGYISDITTGLVTVINSYTIRFATSYSSLASRSTAGILSAVAALPSPLSNDVRLCVSALNNRFAVSSTSDTSLALNSILKFMDSDVSASLFPAYWAEQGLLSIQSLAYMHYRTTILSQALASFITATTNDIVCSAGYGLSEALLPANIIGGTRALNYIGLSIRQLLKSWLRWGDAALLSSGWYAVTLGDSIVHSMLGVRQRVTDAVMWASRVESTHNKVCFGAIVTVGDDIVRYTGLAYEVQALSVSLLVYVSAIWRASVAS